MNSTNPATLHREIMQHLTRIENKLDLILGVTIVMDASIQAQLDNLNTEVTNQTTVEQSAVTLLNGLSASLAAALANQNPADVVAAVQTISDHLQSNTNDLAAAVAANTPAPAAPAPDPNTPAA